MPWGHDTGMLEGPSREGLLAFSPSGGLNADITTAATTHQQHLVGCLEI